MFRRAKSPQITTLLTGLTIGWGASEPARAAALGTEITFQGQLKQDGTPAPTGSYQMIFDLYDDPDPLVGTLLATEGPLNVSVADGVFSQPLDFGGAAFDGSALWIRVTVEGTPLSPLQPVNATPYALFALDGAGAGGTPWQVSGGDVYYLAGNVGIGTATPSAPLEVAGSVRASSFSVPNPNSSGATVNLNWHDDVARIRYGGSGTGDQNGFAIQGQNDSTKLRLLNDGSLGQTSHRVDACSDRFGGPCGSDVSATPPSPPLPLYATASDGINYPPQPGAHSWMSMNVELAATRPVQFTGSSHSGMTARYGNEIACDATVRYLIDDETMTFTRTDQPAAPGETVNVRMRLQYRFTAIGNGPPLGSLGSGMASFDYATYFHNSGVGGDTDVGHVSWFQGRASIDTGWVNVTTGYATVPLDTPFLLGLGLSSTFKIRLDTSAPAGYVSMSASSSMQWRLLATPFDFQGPGAYTADAPQLLIVDNTWPAPACAVGDYDCDGDIDVSDHAALVDCFSGPYTWPDPTPPATGGYCLQAFDSDEDDDVDLIDFQSFQGMYSGPAF